MDLNITYYSFIITYSKPLPHWNTLDSSWVSGIHRRAALWHPWILTWHWSVEEYTPIDLGKLYFANLKRAAILG